MRPVLTVGDYALDYATPSGALRVLDGVSLEVGVGEVLGLVGESGSGKSSLAAAIMRLLPSEARERGGSIVFNGEDLRAMDERRLRDLRGRRIAMVFQDPAMALNPTFTRGRQLTEVLESHRGFSPRAARREALAMLAHVEIQDPEAIFSRYPLEVSGGEKQRVVIATALGCHPDLVLLDEPTTALDALTGARVLELFRRLRAELGVACLYISHHLTLVSRNADRIGVIRRGCIIEQQAAHAIFRRPQHRYTRLLAEAAPQPDHRLVKDDSGGETLIEPEHLRVYYARPGIFGRKRAMGIEDISFTVRAQEIFGVIGESGSGKSTLARALTGLLPFTGAIRFAGRSLTDASAMDRAYRSAVQIVFQNPDSSLNPRHRVRDILARPLRLFGHTLTEVPKLIEEVQLPTSYATRFPHELSGGEKQRVAIARALAARPQLIICDEITASLDVSVQLSVIEMLIRLREEHGTTFLFITHDLNLLCQIAHRVAVIYRGRLVDPQMADQVRGNDVHPYTRALITASPPPLAA